MIQYLNGDATLPVVSGNRIIAHICNDAGLWGRGFVLAISRRWRGPEVAYRDWHRGRSANDFGLGAVQLVRVGSQCWVANMVAQYGTRSSENASPVRYNALRACLVRLAAEASFLSASVHMPRIGCGLAGGSWEEVELLISRELIEAGISVSVYDLSTDEGETG